LAERTFSPSLFEFADADQTLLPVGTDFVDELSEFAAH
jgi:hypothetical protein